MKKIIILLSILKSIFSQLSILYPYELTSKFKDDQLRFSNSLYGMIPYGQVSQGYFINEKINIPNKYDLDLCDIKNISKEIQEEIKNNSKNNLLSAILVKRGLCTFVTKSRNAQIMGLNLLILIDKESKQSISETIINDDGTGSDIKIPTIMISNDDGETILEFMKSKKNENNLFNSNDTNVILFEINFEIPKTSIVNYRIFMSSDSVNIYSLLNSWSSNLKNFEESISFDVFYVSFSTDAINYSNNKIIHDNCLTAGIYCATPRTNPFIKDGREILYENIRQKCIFNFSKSNDKFLETYFKYMDLFNLNCIKSNDFNEKCSKNIIKSISTINNNKINECYNNSFENSSEKEKDENFKFIVENTILYNDFNVQKKYNVNLIPTILVNNVEIFGLYSFNNSIKAICNSFALPQLFCIENSLQKNNSKNNDISTSLIVIIVIIVLMCNITVVIICKRIFLRKIHENLESNEINSKIDNVVSTYLALKDTK